MVVEAQLNGEPEENLAFDAGCFLHHNSVYLTLSPQ
jgi:hypothetical protein